MGLCGRCLSEFIDWRFSHVGIFDPALNGVLRETIFCRSFNTFYLTRFRTYNIDTPPKQKPWREGASDRYTPDAKSLYR
jgi:hypothetical protein